MTSKVFLATLALCAFVAVTFSAPGGYPGIAPAPYIGRAPIHQPWLPWKPSVYGILKSPCGFCPPPRVCFANPYGLGKCKCPLGLVPHYKFGCVRAILNPCLGPVSPCYRYPGAICKPLYYPGRPAGFKCLCGAGPYGPIPCGLRPVFAKPAILPIKPIFPAPYPIKPIYPAQFPIHPIGIKPIHPIPLKPLIRPIGIKPIGVKPIKLIAPPPQILPINPIGPIGHRPW